MQSREIITDYSENNTKGINTLCGQDAELLNIKAGFTQITSVLLKG
jgi:hypothetical protein